MDQKIQNSSSSESLEEQKSSAETLGAFIRRHREAQKVSVKDLALRTRVNSRLIKELEEDHLKNLPDRTYVRGFIKAFAKEIRFDLDTALNLLDVAYDGKMREAPVNLPKKVETYSEEPEQEKSEEVDPPDVMPIGTTLNFSKKIFFLICVVGLLVFMGWGAKKIFEGIKEQAESSSSNVEVPPPSTSTSPVSTVVEIPVAEKKVEMFTPAAAVPYEKERTATTNSAALSAVALISTPNASVAPTPEAKSTPDANKAKKVEFKKYSSSLFTFKNKIGEEVDDDDLTEDAKKSVKEGVQTVFINATAGDCWITYKKDQDPIRVVMLSKGQNLTLQGKEVRLFMGNPKATKVFYNNRQINMNSATGVKSMVFPSEGAKKYLFPLFVHDPSGRVYTGEEFKKIQDQQEAQH